MYIVSRHFSLDVIELYVSCFLYLLVELICNSYSLNLVFQIEGPIHSSNVMLYSKEKEVASRVGHKVLDNGKRVRYLIKTGEIIDSAENWKELKEEKRKTEETTTAAS